MSKRGPILLIDDDADEYELVKDALQAEGIANELHCFASGEEGLRFLQTATQKPFLILSDINMRGMNGLELRRRINADEALRKKSIPFIFFTTTASPAAVSEAYEMSVQGFFEKPDSVAGIRALLREIFDYWQRCRHPNQ